MKLGWPGCSRICAIFQQPWICTAWIIILIPQVTKGLRRQKGGYVDRLPKDPWGTVYNYLQPGSRGEYDIYSFGADGSPGGQGINADIGNWEGE